ncbi:MAG: iron-sulfur cluster assembly accessory protein [Planctomycetia bacterium]|nr:iron-sulfur cluster assembly accessory protein [Planctomycetia bacterium]
MSITLTDRAIQEIKAIKTAQELGEETFLRMIILGGGCSGMQYSLGFDTEFDAALDAQYDNEGVKIVAKKTFDLFLDGTHIDFIDTPMSKGFSIDNPNFPSGGGCPGCHGH